MNMFCYFLKTAKIFQKAADVATKGQPHAAVVELWGKAC